MFEGDEKGRIYKIFEDAFNAPVIMKNNVAFMALGESEVEGFESNYGMSLFLYVGYGIATSVLYKGKALSGWRGYAGEIGYNKFESGESLFSNVTVSYMIQKSKHYLKTPDIEGLKEAYKEKYVLDFKKNATLPEGSCKLENENRVIECGVGIRLSGLLEELELLG